MEMPATTAVPKFGNATYSSAPAFRRLTETKVNLERHLQRLPGARDSAPLAELRRRPQVVGFRVSTSEIAISNESPLHVVATEAQSRAFATIAVVQF